MNMRTICRWIKYAAGLDLICVTALAQPAPPGSPLTLGRPGLGGEHSIVDGNPAGLALRSGSRLWIGVGQEDVLADWDGGVTRPQVSNVAAASTSPSFGAVWASENFVLAIGASRSAQRIRLPDGTPTIPAPWRDFLVSSQHVLHRVGAALAMNGWWVQLSLGSAY
jgi:hypothetical protein